MQMLVFETGQRSIKTEIVNWPEQKLLYIISVKCIGDNL